MDGATLIFNPIMALIFQFGGWIVWYIGGRDVLGEHMSLGSLIAYLAYLAMFYGPLTMLTQFTNWLTQFSTQAHRIFEIFDTPIEIPDVQEPARIDDFRDSIVFSDVTFGYNRNAPVLTNMSLKIRSGEMVGIVGRSGSGKTTIVNLISRFYDVNEGALLIDGTDIRRIAKGDLRKLVGVVLQEPSPDQGLGGPRRRQGGRSAARDRGEKGCRALHLSRITAAARGGSDAPGSTGP